MRWPDQTSALCSVDCGRCRSLQCCEAAEAGARRLWFLKKILRIVVDFDEEL